MTFGEQDSERSAWLGNEGQEAANRMVATCLDNRALEDRQELGF